LQALAVDPLQLKPDMQQPAFQVDIFPTQPERLALAQAHRQRHRVESAEAILGRDVEEVLRLRRSEGLDLETLVPWPRHQGGDVSADQAPAHRLVQSRSERPQGAAPS
jgi:hypothetical protein